MGGGSGGMASGLVVLTGVPLPSVVAVARRVLGLVVVKRVARSSEMVEVSSLVLVSMGSHGTSGLRAVSALTGGLLSASLVFGLGVRLFAGVRLPSRGSPLGGVLDGDPASAQVLRHWG